ncbi:MAG TPA: right-handed parallel beta-helix repeat-containing protein [Thiolinea sp.]|nr:right-handed parallel beta-helix repeat-containing protein [Thiolinea sp.]
MNSTYQPLKTSLLAMALAVFLSGCDDENVQEVVDGLFEDKDYSSEITWPAQVNSACPDWKPRQTVTISESMQLPQHCVFEQVTLIINRPDVDFDCNGAVFNGISDKVRHEYGDSYRPPETAPQGVAFRIRNSDAATTPLSNITIRNCQITNYIHGVDVALGLSAATRRGLRAGNVNEDSLRAVAPGNVQVLGTRIINTHGSGIYIYPYVTGFQLRNSRIKGTDGPGLYLDNGTRDAVIQGSVFMGNGFSSYDPDKLIRSPRRSDAAKREAIAIDASSGHAILNNTFRDNADGGVYLYKNCWEYAANANQIPRTGGANNNRIEGNRFRNETRAVWLAERADRDLHSWGCGDPVVYEHDGAKYYRDYAQDNVVAGNRFENVHIGVQIMDNNNTVRDNVFVQTKDYDIEVGSRIREYTHDPVAGNTILNNTFSGTNAIHYQFGAQ